jgi:putative IMPACT (imprinted ancient) family translation regulator
LEKHGKVVDINYGEQVSFTVLVPGKHQNELEDLVKDATGGQVMVEEKGTQFSEI